MQNVAKKKEETKVECDFAGLVCHMHINVLRPVYHLFAKECQRQYVVRMEVRMENLFLLVQSLLCVCVRVCCLSAHVSCISKPHGSVCVPIVSHKEQ